MRKQEVDYLLTTMLDSHQSVSDLNFTVGKPLQVETFGELVNVDMKPPLKSLTPFQTEMVALNLLGRDRRLTEALLRDGSCDLSYSLPGKARFRVNVFSRSGDYSVVLRQLDALHDRKYARLDSRCSDQMFVRPDEQMFRFHKIHLSAIH